jgi:hypothetical protein
MWGNNWKCRPEVNKFMKNWAYLPDIGKAAYDTMFGTAQKAGSLFKDVIGTVTYD